MKLKLLAGILLINLLISKSFSQKIDADIILNGKVIDEENKGSLVYVNLGLLNKAIGSLTDTSGNFTFRISNENLSDTIQISLVGFDTKKISVQSFLAASSKYITLKKNIKILSEVFINNKIHTSIIGRTKTGKLLQMSIHNKKDVTKTIGSEMGMIYNNEHSNSIFKDFNFYLTVNNFNTIKFRLNIYAVKDKMPDTLICNRQIITTIDNLKTGWNKVDLSTFNIKTPECFIITLQWVDSKMEKKDAPLTVMPVALEPFSKNCFIRIASQDKWTTKGIALSNFVTIAY